MTITREEIAQTLHKYRVILIDEAKLRLALEFAQDAVKFRKMTLMREIYFGEKAAQATNDKKRDIIEFEAFDGDVAYQILLGHEKEASEALYTCRLEKSMLEAGISLNKAWMYAQSGGANFNG